MAYRIIAVFLLIATPLAFAGKEKPLDELIQQAAAAPTKSQPNLYTKIAERQLKAADNFYRSGDENAGRAAVSDVVTYLTKAEQAAIESGKRLKDTEIAVRKAAERLRGIERTLAFEDQPPVKEAAARLEELRNNLLTRMFGASKKKDK